MTRRGCVVVCVVVGLVASAMIGCGGSDDGPKGLCGKIYKERVEGPVLMFRENGPKNKDAFLAYCEKQPAEYLKCEEKDMFKMSDDEAKKCRDLIMKYQSALNDVLAKSE